MFYISDKHFEPISEAYISTMFSLLLKTEQLSHR